MNRSVDVINVDNVVIARWGIYPLVGCNLMNQSVDDVVYEFQLGGDPLMRNAV